jgi:hypothetical protein
MSEPTAGERAFASAQRLDPTAVARARDVLNAIVSLPWMRSEQISLVARLARKAAADVGEVLAALALNRAPLADFTALLPIKGIGNKRLVGLVRALSPVEISDFSPEAALLRNALNRISVLTTENNLLRGEVDRLNVALSKATGAPASTLLTVREVAGSIGEQIATVDGSLRRAAGGLRLSGVELRVQGTAGAVQEEVAIDVAAPAGGSAVALRFAPAGIPDTTTADFPLLDVRGYGAALARRKLTAAGLNVVFYGRTGTTEPGVVSAQTPSPGTLVAPGTVVRLQIGPLAPPPPTNLRLT